MMEKGKLPYSLCIDALYRNETLSERLTNAREAGFARVECWTLGDKIAQGFAELLPQNGLKLTAFCPDFFVLNDPAVRSRYLDELGVALENARELNCSALITQVGQDNGQPRQAQAQSIVEGLKAAAPMLEKAGVTLLVEPLNTVKDHKGYFLASSQEGFDMMNQVDSGNVRILYDVYHMLHMGEDVKGMIDRNWDMIGHFHVAGFPARDERLFDGAYDHAILFQWLQEKGNEKPIGVELFPSSCEARARLFARLQEGV